jgi:transposase InsO family protein
VEGGVYRAHTTKAPRRGVHRRKRERRPLPGMMLFQDGSEHAWLPSGPDLDLIVTMDDATSAILSIFLCEEEGTASSFRGLSETIRADGLFSSFYTDRGSHYFTTPKAGDKVDKVHLTQVGRALRQLNIEHIPSYTPQARGRMERVWDTLQKRLPPLLRMNGIMTIEAANRWLADVYRQHHNARFAVAAAEEGSAFIPFVGDLDNILCIEQERVAGLDNTVRYDGRVLQIPPSRHRHHFARTKIRVLEYWDGAIALFHGPREIARYHRDGTLNEAVPNPRKSVA